MTRGLRTELTPEEEVVLRRIAHGSVSIEARHAARLVALALVERSGAGLRLTPLGRLRFEALPKAPLLARPRSMRAITGYISAIVDKAQALVGQPGDAPPPPLPAGPPPRPR